MQRKLQTWNDTASNLMRQAAGHFTPQAHSRNIACAGAAWEVCTFAVKRSREQLANAADSTATDQALLHIMDDTGKQSA